MMENYSDDDDDDYDNRAKRARNGSSADLISSNSLSEFAGTTKLKDAHETRIDRFAKGIPVKSFDAHSAWSMLHDSNIYSANSVICPIMPQSNQVYVFEIDTNDSKYWNNDGYVFRQTHVNQKQPWRNPKIHMWKGVANINGVELVKIIYYPINGTWQEEKVWNPPRVIIYYRDGATVPTFQAQPLHLPKPTSRKNGGKKQGDATAKTLQTNLTTFFRPNIKSELQHNSATWASHSGPSGPLPLTLQPPSHFKTCEQSHSKKIIKTIDEKLEEGKKGKSLYIDLVAQGITELKPGEELVAPVSVKQIYNRTYERRRKAATFDNDIIDVQNFSKTSQGADIIRDLRLSPALLMIQRHPILNEHFIHVVRNAGKLVFHYDTTYNIGRFYTSILNVRHPWLEGMPVFPLQFMYHEYTDSKSSHLPFFMQAVKDFPMLNTSKAVIITDREQSILNTIAAVMPKANHIFCYNHIFQNVKRWCEKIYPRKESRQYLGSIRKLLWAENIEDYSNIKNTFAPHENVSPIHFDNDEDLDELGNFQNQDVDINFTGENVSESCVDETWRWDSRFAKYFEKYLHKHIQKIFRGVASKFGIFNVESGVTNNSSESINAVAKRFFGSNASLYEVVQEGKKWQISILADISRAIDTKPSNYKVVPAYKSQMLSLPSIKLDCLKPTDVMRQRTDSDNLYFPNDINYARKLEEAEELYDSKAVSKEFERGLWTVRDVDGYYKVNFPDRTCTCKVPRCIHLLAVFIDTGVIGHPHFQHLLEIKPSTAKMSFDLHVSKKTGKKGKGLRVPAVYDPVSHEFSEKPIISPEAKTREIENDAVEVVCPSTPTSRNSDYALGHPTFSLPRATNTNAWLRLFEIGGNVITLRDLKTLDEDITRDEITCLQSCVSRRRQKNLFKKYWLTDEIINAYLFCSTHHSIDTFVLTSLQSKKMFDQNCWDFLRKKILLERPSMVIIPVFQNDNHWTILVACSHTRKIHGYDPKGTTFVMKHEAFKFLLDFLSAIFGDGVESWQTDFAPSSVKQTDSDNCGLFVLHFVDQVIKKCDLNTPVDVSIFRQKVLKTLVGTNNLDKILKEKDKAARNNKQ